MFCSSKVGAVETILGHVRGASWRRPSTTFTNKTTGVGKESVRSVTRIIKPFVMRVSTEVEVAEKPQDQDHPQKSSRLGKHGNTSLCDTVNMFVVLAKQNANSHSGIRTVRHIRTHMTAD